jgi:hypothetical protein
LQNSHRPCIRFMQTQTQPEIMRATFCSEKNKVIERSISFQGFKPLR